MAYVRCEAWPGHKSQKFNVKSKDAAQVARHMAEMGIFKECCVVGGKCFKAKGKPDPVGRVLKVETF